MRKNALNFASVIDAGGLPYLAILSVAWTNLSRRR